MIDTFGKKPVFIKTTGHEKNVTIILSCLVYMAINRPQSLYLRGKKFPSM